MADINRTTITGRLGRDGEMRYTPQGMAITKLNVAVSIWKKADKAEETTWYTVTAFGKLAEHAAQLNKGQKVFVDGRVSLHEWDGNDGRHHARLELVADILEGFAAGAAERPASPADIEPDDIPF